MLPVFLPMSAICAGYSTGRQTGLGLDPADADSDDDGVRDGWETYWVRPPLGPDSDDGGTPDGMLAGPDSEGDRLGDYVELYFSSNPDNPDTDGDGLSDVDELTIHHTNPIDPHTDWDGVNDGNEVFYFGKDPRHFDFY
jgi:hypothetical protein